MIFNKNKHKADLYNTLLHLSRNVFFYKKIKLNDSFETRIYLMFIHFSIMMIIFKAKGEKFSQFSYDSVFHNIENNLRELGFGDVTVNKKMKDLNKLFYDILIKINLSKIGFKLNKDLFIKYFDIFRQNEEKLKKCTTYFNRFYKFCFDKNPKNMLQDIKKFK